MAPCRTVPARSAPFPEAQSGAVLRGATTEPARSFAERTVAVSRSDHRNAPELLRVVSGKCTKCGTTSIYDQQRQVSRQQPSSQNCSEAFSDLTDPCRSPSIVLMHAGKSENAEATGTAVPWDPDGAPCSRCHTKNCVP